METKICIKCNNKKSIDEFIASKKICKQCRSEYDKEYYKKNSDAIKARSKEWYTENREAGIVSRKKYAEKNYDALKAKKAIYRKENREKIRSEQNKRYSEDVEFASMVKKKTRDYYKNNIGKCSEYHKKYRLNNIEKIRERRKQFYIDNREALTELNKRTIENATDGYCRHLLKNKGFELESITPELIKFQRSLIKLKREVKNG